jgi:hypothetical protein
MKSILLFLFILCGFGIANGQTAYDENANVPHKYYELSLKFIKETPGFTPPVASRALGYTGLCLYESVVNGMPNYQSLVGDLPGFNAMPQVENATYSWSVVANNALAFLLDSLYDNKTLDNKVLLYATRTDLNIALQAQLPADVYERSVQFGEAVGLAIFEYSKTESGYRGQYKNFPASYVPPSGNEFWVPLPNQVALQPYWSQNRAFMPENVTNGTLPPPPPSFSTDPTSAFYAYANQVYLTSQNLTQAQKDIASFWADGGGTFTPPGHSISMLRQILRQENWDLGHSALAYAKMGLSLSDAFLDKYQPGMELIYRYAAIPRVPLRSLQPVGCVERDYDRPVWRRICLHRQHLCRYAGRPFIHRFRGLRRGDRRFEAVRRHTL